jgi:hypothetical protein
MGVEARTVAEDAAWLPHFYEPARDTLTFAYAPRRVRDEFVFLDPRFMQDVPLSEPIALDDLDAAAPPARAGSLHFIFHSAFCCSTLLARALEIPGASSSLREPVVLAGLNEAFLGRPRNDASRRALRLVLQLLSRPLDGREIQIVKPSNIANPLAREALALRPDGRAILLYSDLEDFLVSILSKGEAGRRLSFAVIQGLRALAPAMPLDRLAREPALNAAAFAWLLQVKLFAEIAREFGPTRVRTLNGATFLDRKFETLTSAAAFFGIPHNAADDWPGSAAAHLFSRHAKSPSRVFSARDRRVEHAMHRADYASEIAAAIDWLETTTSERAGATTLGNTLFDAA